MVDDGGGLFQISNEKKTIVIQKKKTLINVDQLGWQYQ